MSIRKKLTILMLAIGLLPTIIVGAVGFVLTSNELRAKTTEQLVSSASKQEQKINGLLQQRQEDVSALTNRFDLQSALGQYLSTGSEPDRTRLDSIIADNKTQTPDIQSITITDLNGKVLATTVDENRGKTLMPDDYYISPNSGTNITIREDEKDSIDKLNITARLSVNKKASGIIKVVFRIDDIVAAVQDYTGLGTTGETVVASKDKAGNSISLFPLRFDTDAALMKSLNSLKLFDPADATKTAVDYRGKDVLVAPRTIGFADWIIATKIDMDEALAPIIQLRNTLIIMLILSSVVIMLIAVWLTEFFTKPILYIANIAQLIGRGNFSSRVNLKRHDEIGVLGESINTMGASLKDFVAHIEAERNQLEVILNSATESILAIDKQGTVLIANLAAAELTRLPVTGIIGQNINNLFTWSQDLQPVAIDYNASTTAIYPDLQYIDHAGTTHFIKIIVAKVSGEQEHNYAQAIVTIHDETKTRELENMKIDFVSMAAHELRTPLASLRGYIELMSYREGKNMSEDANKYLKQALKSSKELGGLINNLLDVTRIERGTLTFDMEEVDLAESVSQSIANSRFGADDKQIRLTYEGPQSGYIVMADHLAIREVINNLVSNAIKYTAPNGSVIVSLKQEGNSYITRVKDTGIGIPKSALPYLFTKFYRVHGGLDSGSTGTGLGLFISKSIIERHNGTISVESEEGVGSVFSFTIPVPSKEAMAARKPDSQQEQSFIRRHRGWVTKNIAR